MRHSSVLRQRLDGPEIIVLPGAYDALSARLAEQAGFDAAFTTGFGFSAAALGAPDFGLLTMSEVMERVRHVVSAIEIPLVADMDTGYGNPLNVVRTVRECVGAGVAGIILEDQEWPKKCGPLRGQAGDPGRRAGREAACRRGRTRGRRPRDHRAPRTRAGRSGSRRRSAADVSTTRRAPMSSSWRRRSRFDELKAVRGGDSGGAAVREHDRGREDSLALDRRAAGARLQDGGLSARRPVLGREGHRRDVPRAAREEDHGGAPRRARWLPRVRGDRRGAGGGASWKGATGSTSGHRPAGLCLAVHDRQHGLDELPGLLHQRGVALGDRAEHELGDAG